jgi:hypothetical protein
MNLGVYVTVYEHRAGLDVRVWPSYQAALVHRDNIALAHWQEEFPWEPMPTIEFETGDAYFKLIGNRAKNPEFFTIHSRNLELDVQLSIKTSEEEN